MVDVYALFLFLVSTGVLKDYLRELPYPLINKQLYEAVLESMALRPLRMGAAGCENDMDDSEHTVSLLDNMPDIERVNKTNCTSTNAHIQVINTALCGTEGLLWHG